MTEYTTPTAVYVAGGTLFLLPCLLLYFAWRSLFGGEKAPPFSNWRGNIMKGALMTAALATILSVVWNASWLYCGGSPHGMSAGPGVWQHLVTPRLLTWGAASMLGFLAKGKGRLLLLGWSASMFFVAYAIFMLQFD